MTPSEMLKALVFCFEQNHPLLQVGRPGIGKTDLVKQSVSLWDRVINKKLKIWHPVIADPTDYKGLPFEKDGIAQFIPYSELHELITTKDPIVCFIDDLGQASISVQAALMQLVLARQIDDKKISDQVRFVAATNRASDLAGVTSILEPVKSRFILANLDVGVNDWISWAIDNNMPMDLIGFIRYRPQYITDFEAKRDLVNSSCPRTVAKVGDLINQGVPAELEEEMFQGCCGEAFSLEYSVYRRMYKSLPNIDLIINGQNVPVPDKLDVLYATISALIGRVDDVNFNVIINWVKQTSKEFQTFFITSAIQKDPNIIETVEYVRWQSENSF